MLVDKFLRWGEMERYDAHRILVKGFSLKILLDTVFLYILNIVIHHHIFYEVSSFVQGAKECTLFNKIDF